MSAPTIGVVGLGVMGGRFAGRLLDAGYTVVGTNRTPARASTLVERGLVWSDTPREVAEASEILLSSVTDDAALASVAAGEDGILDGLRPGAVYVDLSTVSPHVSRDLAERVQRRGASMLDAPVSGSVPQADTGTLTIVVGGDAAAFERVEPVLSHLGTVVRVGGNGQGLLLKLAINVSLAEQIVAFANGAVLAERGGIDRTLALDVMTASAIGSPLIKGPAPLMLDPGEESWFDIQMMQKDLVLALDAARRLKVPMPTTAAANELLTTARALGCEHRDIASVHDVLTELAGGR